MEAAMQTKGTRFVAFSVSDALEDYYKDITLGLEQVLGIPALFRRLDAHITLVPPFKLQTRGQYDALDTILRKCTKGHTPFMVDVGEIGEFDNGEHNQVLYLKVKTTPELLEYVQALQTEFRQVFEGEVELKEMEGKTLHVSLAREFSKEKLADARKYIATRALFYNAEILSRVTLYRRSKQGYSHWVKEQDYSLE